MTHHPASTIDAERAAKAFAASLTGRGPHWDETMAVMHPKMADSGNENAWYVIDNCIDEGICESEPEPGSDEEFEILTRWCEKRAQTCKQKMHQVAIENGHILAHRIIDSEPENLKASLGIFWSHDFGNWPDPVTPWGRGRGAFPTLLIEALVPIEAVDWQISCTALMDWMVGDCESELRLKPGYTLKEVRGFYLSDRKPIILPDKKYISLKSFYERKILMNKILAPLTVEGTEVTTQTLRDVVQKMIRLPKRFKAMDLIAAVPSKGHDIHFQQEVLNRVMQRWRRMDLVTFEKKHWILMPGGRDKLLKALEETEQQ